MKLSSASTQTDVAAVLMALTQGVAAWVALTPDIRHLTTSHVEDENFMHDMRRSEATASAITLSVGAVGTALLKSVYPILASAIIVGVLLVVYEMSIKAARPSVTKENEK